MINIKSLNKYFNKGSRNELHVLNNVNLTLSDTGLNVILGKSGSGKTTLLNVIGGLDKAKGILDYSETSFNKYSMSRMDEFRNKNIGYIFQNYLLLPNETVYNNIDIALKIAGISEKKERALRITKSLEAVSLLKYKRKLASSLSGGQKQRVAIARALAKLPKIIICDEPTGNLDSENSIEIMKILAEISKDRLVLMVSHNEKLTEAFADKIIYFKDGNIDKIELNNKKNGKYDDVSSNEVIYLNQFIKKETNLDNIDITRYSDAKTLPISIKIVEKNGKRYIFIDDENTILNDKNIIIKDKEEEIKVDNLSKFDCSEFKDVGRKRSSIKENIKKSLVKFFNAKAKTKKQKFSKNIFRLLSIVFSISVITTSVNINNDDINYAKSFYSSDIVAIGKKNKNLDPTLEDNVFNEIVTHKEKYKVNGFHVPVSFSSLMLGINYLQNNRREAFARVSLEGLNNINNSNYIFGNKPTNKYDVALSTGLIDAVAKNFIKEGNNYDILLNTHLKNNDGRLFFQGSESIQPKIVGITEEKIPTIYLAKDGGLFLLNELLGLLSISVPTNEFYLSGEILDAEIKAIKDPKDYSGYINLNVSSDLLHLYSSYVLKVFDMNVVGEITNKTNTVTFNSNNDFNLFKKMNEVSKRKISYLDFDSNKLLKGNMPSLSNEIIAPDIYEVGDKIILNEKNFTISGIYKNNERYLSPFYLNTNNFLSSLSYFIYIATNTSSEIMLELYRNYKLGLYSDNVSETISLLEKDFKNYKISSIFNAINQAKITSTLESPKITGIILMIFIIIMVMLMIILSVRSKLIHDIYDIGVYRSIGASRYFVSKLYLADTFINTTFLMIIPTTLTFAIYWILSSIIPIPHISFFLYIISIVVIYLINLIGTIIPISILLHKTPHEICTKYDI